MAKGKIISNPIVRKQYQYEMGGINLAFTLRNDNTKELLIFNELLKRAMTDIDFDIKNFRKK